LGHFALFTRFCALAQATDISSQTAADPTIAALSTGGAAVVAVAVANVGEAKT
ncbi:MAG: SIR2 family protein, partial [Alcaligenaceae bacterium]